MKPKKKDAESNGQKEQARTTLKKAALIKANQKCLGVRTKACEMVGVERECFYRWYNNDIEFRRQIDDADTMALDFALDNLQKQIKSGEVASTIFLTKILAHKRGWYTQQKITGKIGLGDIGEMSEEQVDKELDAMNEIGLDQKGDA